MLPTQGYAVKDANAKFALFNFERREVGPHDVLIKILYCGICHSDIHQARDEWGGSIYPMVPGHEIVGKVIRVGDKVKKFKVDDLAGVGCFVDSCRHCHNCKNDEQQFCEHKVTFTYNSTEQNSDTPTYGGYSSQIVVDEQYVLRVSSKLPLANVAPLLCAGITTYSPLRYYQVDSSKRVAVMGLGGLGHMAVKLASSMGAHVTVLSTSPAKQKDAHRLGANDFILTADTKQLQRFNHSFDFILDTISAPHDINIYLNLLRTGGIIVLVGVPEKPLEVDASSLIDNRRALAGSMIGGIRETQEMLDYCAEKNISADVEIIPIQQLEMAYERTVKNDVHYRFVIDMTTF